MVPADLILLYSQNAIKDSCYIDTVNLDGESNLKKVNIIQPKEEIDDTDPIDYVSNYNNMLIQYEKESDDFYSF